METSPLTRRKLLSFRSLLLKCKKHPRLRGENLCFVGDTAGVVGNIPAYAEKTRLESCRQRQSRKHPRLRGENLRNTAMNQTMSETSPLTRRKPVIPAVFILLLRNIPAYAEKTDLPRQTAQLTPETSPLTRRKLRIVSLVLRFTQKHPRLRGENDCLLM